MAKGRRTKPRLGTMTGDWDPFQFREDLFRVGRGESRPQPSHGYPLLEMLRWAKYGFDKYRNSIPAGKVIEFEERIIGSMHNAALVEIHHQAELRLMDRLRKQNCIAEKNYYKNISDIKFYYDKMISEAGYAVAETLAVIQVSIMPRRRGRPSKKLLPDEADIRDWHIIMLANSQVSPPFDDKSPLEQCLDAIPAAVKRACDEGILTANTQPNIVSDSKQHEAHIKRISSKAMKMLNY